METRTTAPPTRPGGPARAIRNLMETKLADPRTRHGVIAALILFAGLIASIVIYLKAGTTPENLLEFSPDTSKKYLRDLELYGGTANVLAVQLKTWFDGLWRGRSLAYTVAVLSVLVSLGYVFFTVVLPPPESSDAPENDGRGPRR